MRFPDACLVGKKHSLISAIQNQWQDDYFDGLSKFDCFGSQRQVIMGLIVARIGKIVL